MHWHDVCFSRVQLKDQQILGISFPNNTPSSQLSVLFPTCWHFTCGDFKQMWRSVHMFPFHSILNVLYDPVMISTTCVVLIPTQTPSSKACKDLRGRAFGPYEEVNRCLHTFKPSVCVGVTCRDQQHRLSVTNCTTTPDSFHSSPCFTDVHREQESLHLHEQQGPFQ